jgi:hypothetical protein
LQVGFPSTESGFLITTESSSNIYLNRFRGSKTRPNYRVGRSPGASAGLKPGWAK